MWEIFDHIIGMNIALTRRLIRIGQSLHIQHH